MASTGGLLRPRARARCRGVCDRARVCVFDFVCSLFALCLLFVCFFFRRCCCLFLLLFVFFLLLFTCFLFAFVLLFLFFAFLFVLFSFIYCLFILCLSGGFIHARTRCVYVYVCVCMLCVWCVRVSTFQVGSKDVVRWPRARSRRGVCDRVLLLFLCLILFALCLFVRVFFAVVCF